MQAQESLAEILARKASVLRRRGEPARAVPLFQEALSLLNDIGSKTKAYSSARLLELESELGAALSETGNFDQAEPLLMNAFRELQKTEGMKSSATQVALRRLIDFFERRGVPQKASAYRKVRPATALADVWDLGPLRLPSAFLRRDDRLSTVLDQRSTWLLWNGTGVPGMGRLDDASLTSGQPTIIETTGPPVSFVSPRSIVADPARRRALVFHVRSERTVLSAWPASPEPDLTFGPDDPQWGKASLAVGDFLYTYACRKIEGLLEMECRLARVAMDRALDLSSWSYYAGSSSWSSNLQDARPVMTLDDNSRFSVQWSPYLKKYLAICTRSLNHRIRIRLADRPEGPWSEPVFEIEGLAPPFGVFPWIRSSAGHPELARNNGRVEYLTYSRTTPSGNQIRVVRLEFE